MISLNLTIFNKGFLLNRVLNGIKENTVGPYELVTVLDGCSDNSEDVLLKFKKENPQIKIKVNYADNIFETKSNNIAAKDSEGDRIIIIQDDMIIKEFGWDQRIQKPLDVFDDIFAVTARTAHNWEYNVNSVHENMADNLDDCWCDIINHTDHAQKNSIDRNTFAVRDCVNRGPLLIDHNVLKKLNYFDEKFTPQDMDDHDLCFRARKELGLRCGCYWIDFESDDDWGGTRENGQPRPWLLKAQHKNMKIVWNRHKDMILIKKQNEDRELI